MISRRSVHNIPSILALLLIISVFDPVIPSVSGKSEVGACEVVSATIDERYDGLFVPQKRGWLGADGAVSIPLTEDKTVWLFGDSILGTITSSGQKKGPMVRNTLAIHDLGLTPPGKVEFYWDYSDNLIGDFFHPENFDGDYWYWPINGASVDGELFIFLYKLTTAEGEPGFTFKMTDTTLVHVSNPLDPPDAWKMTYRDLGIGDNHLGICSAVLVENGYFHLLGFEDPKESPEKRVAILARVSVEDLENEPQAEDFEFWSKGGGESDGIWRRDTTNLKPLFTPGVTESSLQYDPKRKRYLAVTHVAFESGVYLVSAPKLTGPWTEPVKVYEVPEVVGDENRHAYAMKSHPELATSPDELVITYVVNTKDFWSVFSDMDVYYPRFVRVKLK